MNYSFFNRLALGSASAGMCIATILTLAHHSKIPLPCGGGTGCEQVAQDPSSIYLGIPVSAYGMAAYFVLVIIAIMRINNIAVRACSLVGLCISLIGTVNSALLTYHSITKIHATCIWCLGSAAMMVVSTICYFATPRAALGVPEGGKPWSAIPWALTPIALISAYAYFGHATKEAPPDLSSVKLGKASLSLLEETSHALGPKSAPVSIVEFADLMCPACRAMHQRLLLFVDHNRGRVRLLYHHNPLSQVEGHENSQYAATLSEQMNDEDFWNFIAKVYSLDEKPSRSDLGGIAAEFHGKRVRSAREAGERVIKELKIGLEYGIHVTPTYIIFVHGKPTDVASSTNLKDVIKKPIYAKIFSPPATAK